MIRRAAVGLTGVCALAGALLLALPPRGLDDLAPGGTGALRLTDRHGHLLREVPTRGLRSHWVPLAELPPWVPAALVAAEDRRFALHPGVDPVAVARATLGNARAGRVVSGGSTITQQLARLLAPVPRRTLRAKMDELLDAFRLEFRLDKETILEQYLNRVAFGRNAIGIDAAARAWFGHGAATLSPGEAAWLAVLPRAPSVYGNPVEGGRLERRRHAILAELRRRGVLDDGEFESARRSLEPAPRTAPPFEAPHLTEWLVQSLPPAVVGSAGTLRTTLDLELQMEVQRLVRAETTRLADRGGRQAAAVVLDNRSGELLALVGSSDFFAAADSGQVNGALAWRQPGSTLKPFTYALAFERSDTPASIVADVPALFPGDGGPFAPRNYGGATNGPVRLREALGSSLNIAAVALLQRVGEERLYSRLVALGLLPPGRQVAEGGLGLTLGVVEVRLFDLATAYGALARGGCHRPTRTWLELTDPTGRRRTRSPLPPEERVFTERASWWVGDILRDDAARIRSFGAGGVLDMPWPVAVKTGTSSDWRDNWAMGYTNEYTVGIWVGDFAGRPMERVSGVTGAAPLLRGVFGLLAGREPLTAPGPPGGLTRVPLCSLSGRPPGPGCPDRIREWLPSGQVAGPPCDFHQGDTPDTVRLPADYAGWADTQGWRTTRAGRNAGGAPRLRRPLQGETYFYDPALPRGSQSVRFEATGNDAVEWVLDGRRLAVTETVHRVVWALSPGRHSLTIRSGNLMDQNTFEVVGSK